MRIRFLSAQTYDTGAPGAGPHFPEGFVLDEADVGKALGLLDDPSVDWRRAFLNRWTQRKLAEQVGNDVKTSSLNDIVVLSAGQLPPKPAPKVEQIEKTDLTKLTKAELEALADKRGVDVSKAKNKAEMIAALDQAETLGK